MESGVGMRAFAVFAAILGLTGCGSVMTLARSEEKIQAALEESRTRCESLPYVFSGVGYDFCTLHAEPPPVGAQSHTSVFEFYALDMVLSGVVDLFALPYTIPKQASDGSIALK